MISVANLVRFHKLSVELGEILISFLNVGQRNFLPSVSNNPHALYAFFGNHTPFRPRQSMSAINIPLSVMLSPVLACRLILDLRERGSETIAQSTGTIAFTAGISSSKSTPGSPFSGLGLGFGSGVSARSSAKALVRPSGVMLSTIGSLPADLGMSMGVAMGSSLELDDMPTFSKQEDAERETYRDIYRSAEMGIGSAVSGIRVEVEKTTM